MVRLKTATLRPVKDHDTGESIVLFPLDEDENCFAEPVPTVVAIVHDGVYYVGELNEVGYPQAE